MSQQARFRSAAKDIADSIVAAARSDDDSVHWLTARIGQDRKTVNWSPGVSLYSGTSGIALFLIEASEILGDAVYRDVALAALLWCEREAAANRDYSFYVGRMGIAFASLRAYDVAHDAGGLERALRLAEGYESYVTTAKVNDLLGGVAGAIVGFLHLHQHTGERFCIEAVHKLVTKLVSTGRWTPEGLCWDVRPENVRGLCGMSHGAAGIAFALLEADAYLGEPVYRELALQALRYEAAYFDSNRSAWPDFRKLWPEPDQPTTPSDDFLIAPGFMDAWCHGAPGIALSRLRAFELLGSNWRDESLSAITRTRQTIDVMANSDCFTLCHGACGNATAFLAASRILSDPMYRSWADEVGERAIVSRERNGSFVSGYPALGRVEDLSLMMGTAGIGHYFLQLLGDVPNVLSPVVRGEAGEGGDRVRAGSMVRVLTAGLLPESTALIESNSPAKCSAFFTGWHDRDEVLAFVAQAASVAGATDQFALELAKLRMRDSCPSFALVTAIRAREKRRSAVVSDDDLELHRFRLGPFSCLWRSDTETDPPRLLRIIGVDVEEIQLTEFSAAVLMAFTEPTTMTSAICFLEETLVVTTDETVSALRRMVRSQLTDALKAGIIVVEGSVAPPLDSARGGSNNK
jgi:hypothetical protein